MDKKFQRSLCYCINGKVVFESHQGAAAAPNKYVTPRQEKRKQEREKKQLQQAQHSVKCDQNQQALKHNFGLLRLHPEMLDLKAASKAGDMRSAREALGRVQNGSYDIAPPLQTFVERLKFRNEQYAKFLTSVIILYTPDSEGRTPLYFAAGCGKVDAVTTYLSLLVLARLCKVPFASLDQMIQGKKWTFHRWLRCLDTQYKSRFYGEDFHINMPYLNRHMKNVFTKYRYSLQDLICFTAPFRIPNVFAKLVAKQATRASKRKPALVMDDELDDYLSSPTEYNDEDEQEEGDDGSCVGFIDEKECIAYNANPGSHDIGIALGDCCGDAGVPATSVMTEDNTNESINMAENQAREVRSLQLDNAQTDPNTSFSMVSWADSWVDTAEGMLNESTTDGNNDDSSSSSIAKEAYYFEKDDMWDVVSEVPSVRSLSTVQFSYRDALVLSSDNHFETPEHQKRLPPVKEAKKSGSHAGLNNVAGQSDNSRDETMTEVCEDQYHDADFIRDGIKSAGGGRSTFHFKGNQRTSWSFKSTQLREHVYHRRTDPRKSKVSK